MKSEKERIFPKAMMRDVEWPPALISMPGGTWRPYGPWRFNREAQIWQRTYDYVIDGDPKVTTQRIKYIGKVADEAVRQDC